MIYGEDKTKHLIAKEEVEEYKGHPITKTTKKDGIVYYTIGELTFNVRWKAEFIADELNRLANQSKLQDKEVSDK